MKVFTLSTTAVVALTVSLAVATLVSPPQSLPRCGSPGPPPTYLQFSTYDKGSGAKCTYGVGNVGQKGNFPNAVGSVSINPGKANCHLSLYSGSNQSGTVARFGTGPAQTGKTANGWKSYGFFC